METHPDFFGSRLIYAPRRAVDDETFKTFLPTLLELQRKFPDFIAGFDLVGQEDHGRGNVLASSNFANCNIRNNIFFNFAGRPLIEYAEELLKYPENINFYFHAAETNWMGTSSDENLVELQLIFQQSFHSQQHSLSSHFSPPTTARCCASWHKTNRTWLRYCEISKPLEDCEGEENWNWS